MKYLIFLFILIASFNSHASKSCPKRLVEQLKLWETHEELSKVLKERFEGKAYVPSANTSGPGVDAFHSVAGFLTTKSPQTLREIMNHLHPGEIAAALDYSGKKFLDFFTQTTLILKKDDNWKVVFSENKSSSFYNFMSGGRKRLTWIDLLKKEQLEDFLVAAIGKHTVHLSGLARQYTDLIKVLGNNHKLVLRIEDTAIKSRGILKHSDSFHLFNKNAYKKLKDMWLIDTGNEKTVIPGIFHTYDSKLVEGCGTCEKMASGHFGAYMLDEDGKVGSGKGAYTILYNGKLIGSLKTVNDRSMVALENVYNDKGDLILIAGGVYEAPKWLTGKIYQYDEWKTPSFEALEITELTNVREMSFSPMITMKAPFFKSDRLEYGFDVEQNEFHSEVFRKAILELKRRAQMRTDRYLEYIRARNNN